MLILLLTSVAVMVGSCQQPSSSPVIDGQPATDSGTISISELGRLLRLRVSESKPTHVTLKNSANTVMIFTVSGGQVYVNTKSLGEVGHIERTGGQVYASNSLVPRIRSAMRAYTPTPMPRRMSGTVVIDAGHFLVFTKKGLIWPLPVRLPGCSGKRG